MGLSGMNKLYRRGGFTLFLLSSRFTQEMIRSRESTVELGPVHHLGAGFAAGAIMVLATNPVWMIKTRMQLQVKSAHVATVRPYTGMFGESISPPSL